MTAGSDTAGTAGATGAAGAAPAHREPPETLGDVETPAAVVDVARVRDNARRAAVYCEEHGFGWRPHVKTHKSLAVARIQLEAGARGLTVATPREAEVMSALTDDLLLAYPPVGEGRIRRLMALPGRVDLKVALDDAAVLPPLARAAREAGRTVGVLVELDTGMGRVGVQGAEAAVTLAREVEGREGLRFRGLAFYPGHIRAPADEQDAALQALARELDETVSALEAVGLTPSIVSGGSTPTLWRSHELPHLTEVRAGTVIFNDRDIAGLGAAAWSECAYTVLATVVSTAVPGRAVVDAGSKALAKESRGGDDASYGLLLDRPEVAVVGLSEEHGILDVSDTGWRPEVGNRVRVVPNHVCVSVNLQDRLLALHEDGTLEAWPLEGRGRGPWTGDPVAAGEPADGPGTGSPPDPARTGRG